MSYEIDYTRIIATLRDESNEKVYKREIGIDSSGYRFMSSRAEYVTKKINEWIEERGNKQHSTDSHNANLVLVGWNFYTFEEAKKIYC